jgi:hypothetical protein
MRAAIGIDPGLSGAVALVTTERVIEVALTPTLKITKTKREYDLVAMRNLLVRLWITGRERHAAAEIVMIEKQQPLPHVQRGVTAAWRSGYGYAAWVAMTVALQYAHQIVHPRTWQKRMHRDVVGKDTKAKSILVCQNLYPGCSLLPTPRCTKPHDGMADAILLARYALTHWEDPR